MTSLSNIIYNNYFTFYIFFMVTKRPATLSSEPKRYEKKYIDIKIYFRSGTRTHTSSV